MPTLPNRHRFVALVLTLLCTAPARAVDGENSQSLALAGASGSDNSSYTYAGLILPLWGGQLGAGWFSSSFLSYLTYRYVASEGSGVAERTVTVHGTGPGLASGLGYGWSGDVYQVAFSTLAGFRNIELSPDLPAGAPSGTVLTLTPQLQATLKPVPLVVTDLLSNFTFGQHSAYDRVRFGLIPAPTWTAGVEGILQHGPGYHIHQEGIYVNKDLEDGISLGASFGRSHQEEIPTSNYGSVSITKTF